MKIWQSETVKNEEKKVQKDSGRIGTLKEWFTFWLSIETSETTNEA